MVPDEEEWNDVTLERGNVIIYSDEVCYSPDVAGLSAKNALKLLKWLEEHREELEKLTQEDQK